MVLVGCGLQRASVRASKPKTPRLTPSLCSIHYTTNVVQFKDFDAACSKGNLVNMYEWGFGPCDDYMSAVKANAGQTQFTFTVRVF